MLLVCVYVTRGIHSLFAVAVLLLLCAERLFARAWYRCVPRLWLVRASQCHCLVEWDDGVRYLWAVWLCRFWGHSHTVLCVSDRMQCADWLSFDLIRLMQCAGLRWVVGGWLGSGAASGAMVLRDGCSCVLQAVVLERQPTLRQHPVDAGQPDSTIVSVARRPRV